ncbi:MAG: tRNA pseudouridine(55) synthase TruB, partial [Ilumatobacteraceae bacterium]
PDATGVLLVGVGYVTRLMKFLSGLDKRYTAEVVLGSTTSTLDDSGEVTARFDMSSVTLDDVRAAARSLTGRIMQVPPMVSALKVDGRRLHELAREGVEVEREARPVTVHAFTVEPTADALVYRIDVTVSSGTYVRSLAADLGTALGGGAHLRALRRHSIGPFDERESSTIDDAPLLPSIEALRLVDKVSVDDDVVRMVRNGRRLPRFAGEGPWALTDDRGALVGVYELQDGEAIPTVVLAEPVS